MAARGRSSTGLDVHLIAAFAYLFGFVSGVLLLVVEKDSEYVRFHAAQSTIVFIGVLVLNILLAALPFVGWLLMVPFLVGTLVLWVYLMFKAFKGVRVALPYVGDLAEDIARSGPLK